MGKRLKTKIRERSPGPATYGPHEVIGEGPKFTMKSRLEERYNQNPGPGTYTIKTPPGRRAKMHKRLKD